MIAIDWGTSRLRAYRIDAAGKLREARDIGEGILAVPEGGFPAALEGIIAGWEAEERVALSGMVGSRQGWVEVPYVDCPADLAAIAAGAREIPWRAGRAPARIYPGLACRDSSGVPDVLRGEEVQALGAVELGATASGGSLLIAGTHSKHLRIMGRAIVSFATFMAGELFGLLREHGILARDIVGESPDAAAFAAGVARARQEGGLLHHLFGLRTRSLTGEITAASAAEYLSGMLVGHAVLGAKPQPPVLVIGAPRLAERYVRACELLGLEARSLAAERATVAGHVALMRARP